MLLLHFALLVFTTSTVLSLSIKNYQHNALDVDVIEKRLDRTLYLANVRTRWDLSKAECAACKFLIKTVQEAYFAHPSQQLIARLVGKVCEILKIEDNFVCQGIASEFRDEVLYVIGKLLVSPKLVCGLLLKNCSDPFDPFFAWNVTFPHIPKPPVITPQLPPSGSPTLKVLHLTDVHWDPLYREGADVDCTESICCRQFSNSTTTRKAGKWGTAASCDVPMSLIKNLLRHVSKEKFDYILLTGDLPPHDVWMQTRTSQLSIIKTLLELLLYHFPKTPILPALGNHESVPVNSFPPHYPSLPPQYDISWLYDVLAEQWKPWITSTLMQSNIRRIASYELEIKPNLRIISINTNYCNNENFWLYLNQSDPDGVLAWLIYRLQEAELKSKKVHIIGHIPTGYGSCLPQWSRNYYNIVNRYESTIAAQFFGHTHFDLFTVFYENFDYRNRATNVAYIAPSVTTTPSKFPAYRIYSIDGVRPNSTYAVLNHYSYMMNVTEANLTGKPQWKLLYNAKDAYNMTSLFHSDWNKVLEDLRTGHLSRNDTIRYYSSDAPDFVCDTECWKGILCHMRNGRSYYKPLCADL